MPALNSEWFEEEYTIFQTPISFGNVLGAFDLYIRLCRLWATRANMPVVTCTQTQIKQMSLRNYHDTDAK